MIRIEEKTIWKWFLHRLAIYKPTFWTCLSSIMVVHHGSSSNFLVLSSDRVCSSSSWWWFACDDKNNTKRTRLWTGIHGTAGDFDRFGHLASRKNRFAASVAPSVCFSRSASFIPCSSAVEGSCHSCIPDAVRHWFRIFLHHEVVVLCSVPPNSLDGEMGQERHYSIW